MIKITSEEFMKLSEEDQREEYFMAVLAGKADRIVVTKENITKTPMSFGAYVARRKMLSISERFRVIFGDPQ